MNIGIMTSNASFLDNYGAALQAYALSAQLKRWGHDVEIINYKYYTGAEIVTADNKVNRSPAKVLQYVFKSDSSLAQKIQHRLARGKRESMKQAFRKFALEYLPINFDAPKTYDDLCKNAPYDCLITGSDQVWNPLIHANRNDPGFFLDFGMPGTTRIAYAPSFGISELPQDCEESLREYVSKLDFLSVRENTGAAILKKVCGMDVQVVLDPTMMADPEVWSQFLPKPQNVPGKYILVYRFGKMDYTTRLVKQVQKQMGLPAIELPLSIESYGKGTTLYYDAGPSQFVGLIRNAEIVLTDSFHASVFSIMNHTPFYTFLRQGKNEKNNMNSRMENLLDSVGLSDRLIYPDCTSLSVKDIQFSNADNIIARRRTESQAYLLKALKGNAS